MGETYALLGCILAFYMFIGAFINLFSTRHLLCFLASGVGVALAGSILLYVVMLLTYGFEKTSMLIEMSGPLRIIVGSFYILALPFSGAFIIITILFWMLAHNKLIPKNIATQIPQKIRFRISLGLWAVSIALAAIISLTMKL